VFNRSMPWAGDRPKLRRFRAPASRGAAQIDLITDRISLTDLEGGHRLLAAGKSFLPGIASHPVGDQFPFFTGSLMEFVEEPLLTRGATILFYNQNPLLQVFEDRYSLSFVFALSSSLY